MKKYFYLVPVLAFASVLSFTSCDNDDDNNNVTPEATYQVVDFEGTYWDALIDSPEYGGPQLYGTSGYGFAEGEAVYGWTDATTQLHSEINAGKYGTAFYSGGAAVSDYHCAVDTASYLSQLSIPTTLNAISGKNFLVVNGYDDETYGDTRAVFSFADGKSREIQGLWLTNTCYFVNAITKGSYTAAATADTFVDVVFYGYNAAGAQTDSVKVRLQDGTTSLLAWKHADLTKLGKIATLKVDFEVSADQNSAYGLTSPAYVALDNFEITK